MAKRLLTAISMALVVSSCACASSQPRRLLQTPIAPVPPKPQPTPQPKPSGGGGSSGGQRPIVIQPTLVVPGQPQVIQQVVPGQPQVIYTQPQQVIVQPAGQVVTPLQPTIISGQPTIISGQPTIITPSSGGAQTCCQCKCVNPAQDMRSAACKATPGCVGMAAPTYGSKTICRLGASNLSCDKDVCQQDNGSSRSWYTC